MKNFIKMSKFLILLLLLSSGFQYGQFQEVALVKTVIKMILKFNTVSDTKNNMKEVFNAIVGAESDESKQIKHNLEVINNKLNYMNNFITNKLEDVHNEIRNLPIKEEILDLERDFSNYIQTVNFAKREIDETLKSAHNDRNSSLQALLESHYDQLRNSMEEAQKHLAPSDHRGKTKGIAEWYERLTTENILDRCGSGNSPQQLLLGLYMDVTKTEIEAMQALVFLTSLQRAKDHVWETLTKRFVWRHNAYVKSFTKAFERAAREHRACVPDKEISWKRGTTFFELEGYNQAVVFHTSKAHLRKALWPSCSNWFETVLAKQTIPDALCLGQIPEACWWSQKSICSGKLHDCLSPGDIKLCIASWTNSRRYIWMKNVDTNEVYGNPNLECSGNGYELEGLGNNCVCHCVEGHNKISLDISLSDITKNRVVTALRFAQKDNIIFIQIKQGTLQPDGRIKDESSSWEPSVPSTASDKLFVFNAPGQGMNLDDLQGADDEVLTGIGFAKADGAPNTRVKLQIKVTKFNYTAGQLGGQSRVISASDQYRTRELLKLDNPITNLLKNPATSSVNENSKKFITFERSSLTSDAGQTTLPLFDGVPVEGRPVSPLSGAGLFHKAATNYGGFFSLRAIGINIAKYFNESVKLVPDSLLVTEGKSFKNIINDLLSEL